MTPVPAAPHTDTPLDHALALVDLGLRHIQRMSPPDQKATA